MKQETFTPLVASYHWPCEPSCWPPGRFLRRSSRGRRGLFGRIRAVSENGWAFGMVGWAFQGFGFVIHQTFEKTCVQHGDILLFQDFNC